jgi:hypothetical protein
MGFLLVGIALTVRRQLRRPGDVFGTEVQNSR